MLKVAGSLDGEVSERIEVDRRQRRYWRGSFGRGACPRLESDADGDDQEPAQCHGNQSWQMTAFQ